MTPDFADFVASYADRTAYDEVFDEEVAFFVPLEELLPDAALAGVDGRDQVGPVPPSAINQAEARLGIELPEAYVYFVTHYGVGQWGEESIVHPSDLYRFDEEMWEMEGAIGLVANVLGVGDMAGIHPDKPKSDGEYPIYHFCHDPFGYGVVSPSFEQWMRDTIASFERTLSDPDVPGPYAAAQDEVYASWRRFRKETKKWWQFWW